MTQYVLNARNRAGVLVIAGMMGACFIFSMAHTQDLELIGTFNETFANSFCPSGEHGYLGSYGFLDVIDLRDPANPRLISQWAPADNIMDVNAESSLVFLTDDYGLKIIDVGVPEYPVYVGEFYSSLMTYDASISGNYAYIVNFYGLSIIDIGDPSLPTFVSSLYTPDEGRGVWISGSYAYVAAFLAGLCIADISNPTEPILLGVCNTPGASMRVCVRGDYAFVADQSSGLQIVSVADPVNPFLVGGFDTRGLALAIAVDSNYAFLAGLDMGLRVFDIGDPSNPAYVAGYDTLGSYADVDVGGGFVFATGGTRLDILRFNPSSAGEAPLPSKPITLAAYPNPFNSSILLTYSLTLAGQAVLSVHNLLGQRMQTIFDGYQDAGNYRILWVAGEFPSGLYYVRLEHGNSLKTTKVVLLK